MSENTNEPPNSNATHLKGSHYRQRVHHHLTQTHEAHLTSVKHNATNTYNDNNTLKIEGTTDQRFNKRNLKSNGSYSTRAHGPQTTTYNGSDMQICLGAKSTMQIGPGFFTGAAVFTEIHLDKLVYFTTLGVGVGVYRVSKTLGPVGSVVGVDITLGQSLKTNSNQYVQDEAMSITEEYDREFDNSLRENPTYGAMESPVEPIYANLVGSAEPIYANLDGSAEHIYDSIADLQYDYVLVHRAEILNLLFLPPPVETTERRAVGYRNFAQAGGTW